MSAESPAEYVEQLREQNKILRANVVQLVREKERLFEELAYLSSEVLRLRAATHRAHDYEPAARPGLSDVD